MQGANQETARQHDIEKGILPGTASVIVKLLVETLPRKDEIKVVGAI